MLKKTTGRPKAENPVDVRFTVCLDKETSNSLDEYCTRERVTKSVAIRRGLSLLFAKKERKNE